MNHSTGQRKLRNCFLPPIPELDQVADLLALAATAMLRSDMQLARTLIVQSDNRAVFDFVESIIGPINPEIHWQSCMPKRTPVLPSREERRMPLSATALEVFQRDGWRCRYCNSRVIAKKAIACMRREFPVEARWGRTNATKHYGMAALCVSLDHVLPHSLGGSNKMDNLVSACSACQFGRNQWTLEEVGFSDPFSRLPVKDDWDGLVKLNEMRSYRSREPSVNLSQQRELSHPTN